MTVLLWIVAGAWGICSAAVVMSMFGAAKRADDFNDSLEHQIESDLWPASVWNAGQPRTEE
jgi:hypothetical protein